MSYIVQIVAVIATVVLIMADAQVVFRPHFVYKQKQAEKESQRRQQEVERLQQQQFQQPQIYEQHQPVYYDPYYYYYYQHHAHGPSYSPYYHPIPVYIPHRTRRNIIRSFPPPNKIFRFSNRKY